MKKEKKIDRRSFIATTGAAAAGLSLMPASLSYPGVEGIPGNSLLPGLSSSQPGPWWTKEPLRIIEFEEGYEYSEKFSLLRELGANTEHATRFTDTSPGTSFLDAHNLFSGKKVSFGSLKEYLEAARQNGIRVVIYYNVHAIEIGYARKHPEWQQIKDDGNPIEDVYSVDSSFCINSPWREEVFATLRKMAAYPIDGVFYDGPIFFSSTCHCATCKKLFREKYGRELPGKAAAASVHNSDEWSDLLEFQSDSIARFLRESNRILKDANPGILFYMNGNTLAPSWPTGRDNRKISRETDILGAEGGFLYGEFKEPVYKPGAMAKLLETMAEGKPTVVFDAAKQGPWSFSTLPEGETSLLYSQTITGQANVWLAISAVANLHQGQKDVIKRYNKFIAENPDPFFRNNSAARIALLWPQAAGNYYSGSTVPLTDFTKEIHNQKAGNTEEEFYGFYDGLSRCHFPFAVIDEEAMGKDLSAYDLLILPNATCLSAEKAGMIKDFVGRGGNLISTFESSAYDERGRKLPVQSLDAVLGTGPFGAVFGPLGWDYVSPTDRDHYSLKGITNRFVNAPEYGLLLPESKAAPLHFCKPLPGSYAGSPEATSYPFITVNNYGKGRSVYIAGTFGASLHRYHFPEYYTILANLAGELSTVPVSLVNAPSSVEINIRKKGKSLFVYLINFTAGMKRPIEKIIPVRDIGITVHSAGETKSVRSLWNGNTLEFKKSGSDISFTIEVLNDYDVIELGS